MQRLQTEFRIFHKTKEDKRIYEEKLNSAINERGFKSRTEWLNSEYRKLIN